MKKPTRPQKSPRLLTSRDLERATGGGGGSESRNIEFEIIKNEIQK